MLRYPEYQDSGVEWLGEVPAHWAVRQGRRLYSQKRDSALSGDEQLSATQKYGVVPQRLFMEMEDQKVTLALSGLDNFKHVEVNDFVISLRSFQGGIERSKYSGCVSPAYTVLRPAIPVDASYMGYVLKSSGYIAALQSVTDGIRDGKNISYEQFGQIGVPCPTHVEQTAIAAFLDRETAKIDALVAEQEKLITLLKEKRQAVISHAVTKGLDPDVPMKDSGIEWLGRVPEHWDVMPLKTCIDFQEGPGIMADDFYDEGTPLLRVSGVQGRWASLEGCNFLSPDKVAKRWAHFKLMKGDLLISASASMGTVSEVGDEAEGAIPYTGLIRLRGREGLMVKPFIRSFMVSTAFITQTELLKAGATIQHFGPTHLRQMLIVRPPIDEQGLIAEFIDSEAIKFDTLVSEAEKAVVLLKERRSALISAAVTGKIDVRGVVAEREAA